MKKYIAALLLFCGIQSQAQEAPLTPFTSPFDFPLYLSANFGELRSNHFHGGIDIKTGNVTGKPVYNIADGYISRVTVSPGGYGNALYVVHDNGYTSVYGHLEDFSPAVAAFVEKYQYEHETFAVDLPFDSLRFPVKQGDRIARSGNTGFSFGPHLHMEIKKTTTGERVDPLPFYRNRIKDTTPPRANAFTIYPRPGKGTVNGLSGKQTFTVTAPGNSNGASCISKPIEAWGEIGIGIKAFDYMDGTANNYGVRAVTLYVDSLEVFNSTMDRYLPDENRMINSYTDFSEFHNRNSWVMKSFAAPGNTFRGLRTDANRGVVTIDRERDYRFRYVLTDLYGNTSVYNFTVKGKKTAIPAYQPDTKHYLYQNKTNIVQEPGMELVIPRGMLYQDIALNSGVRSDSSAISFDYRLHDEPHPLHAGCDLTIGIRNRPITDTSKYYIARKAGKARYYAGGKYKDGWIKTSIRELGTYTVAIDTVPPRAVPVGKASWGRTGTLTYKISDGQTGIETYKGKIDGKFALFAFNAKTSLLTCRLNPRRVRKGGTHTLELTVTDCRGNTETVKETFIW